MELGPAHTHPGCNSDRPGGDWPAHPRTQLRLPWGVSWARPMVGGTLFREGSPCTLVSLGTDWATHVKWRADTTWCRKIALSEAGSNAIKCLEALEKKH